VPVNMGHVFAGLSQKYFPKVSFKYSAGSYLMGGFTALDERARTNIGDIGAALLAAIKSNGFRDSFTEDNPDQDKIFDILNE